MLPGHVELFVHQHPQVLFLRASLNPFSAQLVFSLGIVPAQVLDLVPGFVDYMRFTQTYLKPDKVPLDGIPFLQCVDGTTHLGDVGKLAEVASIPVSMSGLCVAIALSSMV